MSNWNKAQTSLFIELYEQFPALYNIKHPDHKNRIKRERNLQEICLRLKDLRPKTSVSELKCKIKTLRSQYVKENAIIKQSKRSGAGAEDAYSPRLWCFDQLKFLDQFEGDVEIDCNTLKVKIHICNRLYSSSDSSILGRNLVLKKS